MSDLGHGACAKSAGLVDLASRSEKNSERDAHQIMATRFGLRLRVPHHSLECGENGVALPVLRPRDFAKYLLHTNTFHILAGLVKPDWDREHAIFGRFWEKFRVMEPQHPVFHAANLDRMVPGIYHGDEGRGRRRTAFLVLNWHGALGRGVQRANRGKTGYHKMLVNYHGPTLSNRFLIAALQKELYTGANAAVWDHLLELLANEAEYLFDTGVSHPDRGCFKFCLIGVAGDWPWLADAADFQRSFRTVQKHKTRKTEPKGVCHLCKVGMAGILFEALQVKRPPWFETMFQESPFLCGQREDSLWYKVPHEPGMLEGLFSFDLFHTWHLGTAKAFLGSVIACLSEMEDGRSIDARFEALSEKYMTWCRDNNERPYLLKLTKESVNWGTSSSYPTGGWHKGNLSTVLMKWVEEILC